MIPVSDENTVRRAPVAGRTIIAATCAVFLWQLLDEPWGRLAGQALGFTPAHFFAGGTESPWLAWAPFSVSLVSYMFLHAGWLHLGGNMLYLWIFGDDVEDALGQPGFIVFYLLAGMAAAVAQALMDPASTIPMVGASGAVSGLLGAYLVLYPRTDINVLTPVFVVWDVVRLPAYAVIGFWFAVQLLYEFEAPAAGGGIAIGAHLGGFVAGMAMTPIFLVVMGRRRTRLAGSERRLIR